MTSVFRSGAPYGKAHEHADRAELLSARGDHAGAAEEHVLAADAYLQAIDACEDPAVKHSLRLMHEDHLKLSRDAQRAQQDRTRQQQQQPQPEPDLAATVTIGQVPRKMVDSTSSSEHTTIEDSYMMLGGRPGEHNEAFDQFWKTLEGMLENLSQPVAFATAPLAKMSAASDDDKSAADEDVDEGAESDASSNDSFCIIDSKEQAAMSKSAKFGSASISPSSSKKSKSKTIPDPSLARSAYPPPPRMQQLEAENAALKSDLERAIMRATAAERTLKQRAGQELALRESILSVRREAQKAMSATTAALRSPAFPGLAPARAQTFVASPSFTTPIVPPPPPAPVPPPPAIPAPVPAIKLPEVPSSRIAELEEEIRQLKAENEKQKAQMAKYRERWEKLKESAKRKRAAKAESSAANVTIPEEQEPEEGKSTSETPVEQPPATPSGLSSHSVLRSPESIVASH